MVVIRHTATPRAIDPSGAAALAPGAHRSRISPRALPRTPAPDAPFPARLGRCQRPRYKPKGRPQSRSGTIIQGRRNAPMSAGRTKEKAVTKPLLALAALTVSIGAITSANAHTPARSKSDSEMRADRAHADRLYKRAYEQRRAAELKVERRKERHDDSVQVNSAERERANHKDGRYKRVYERRRAEERSAARRAN